MTEEEQIKTFLQRTSLLLDNEIEMFLSKRQSQPIAKGDYLIKAGQLCKSLYFVHTGVLSLLLLNDGEEYVKDFSLNGKFITAYTSFTKSTPSEIFIRAEQDCEVSLWDGDYVRDLIQKNHHWTMFAKTMADYLFQRKEHKEISMILHTAEERYLRLLQEFPAVFQQVPQYLIASYLGIKPQSLSRIRKMLAHKH
jgi:CRP/FNR family transcriptional regulator, anaerobic regulatory protein